MEYCFVAAMAGWVLKIKVISGEFNEYFTRLLLDYYH